MERRLIPLFGFSLRFTVGPMIIGGEAVSELVKFADFVPKKYRNFVRKENGLRDFIAVLSAHPKQPFKEGILFEFAEMASKSSNIV